MRRLWVLTSVALIAAVAIGCSEEEATPSSTGSATASPGASSGPDPSTQPSSSPVPTATGLLTYTDPAFGYSFDYPASWYVTGAPTALYSYDPATAAGDFRPVPLDKLKAIFRVVEGVDKPVAEWLTESRSDSNQPPTVVLSTSEATVGGRAGIYELIDEEGQKVAGYYIDMGAGRLLIIGAGPADSVLWSQFDQVLKSLRFAP